MAYAALVYLSHTIHHIMNHHHYFFSLHQKQQLASIHKHTISLQAFLVNSPGKANTFEERIRAVAHQAEDMIEYVMLKETRPLEDLCYELDKLMEEIHSVAGEKMNIKNKVGIKDLSRLSDSPSASSSSRVAPSQRKDAMVGLGDDLLAIKTRLCGEPS